LIGILVFLKPSRERVSFLEEEVFFLLVAVFLVLFFLESEPEAEEDFLDPVDPLLVLVLELGISGKIKYFKLETVLL